MERIDFNPYTMGYDFNDGTCPIRQFHSKDECEFWYVTKYKGIKHIINYDEYRIDYGNNSQPKIWLKPM